MLSFDDADDFVTLVVTREPFLLMLAKLELNVEGISCRLMPHDPLGLGEDHPALADDETLVEVQVREGDLERATEVLRDLDPECDA